MDLGHDPQVIDAVTSEVLMSMTGNGVSRSGRDIPIGGIGDGVASGIALTSSEFPEFALGEVTERAVEALVAQIAAKPDQLR